MAYVSFTGNTTDDGELRFLPDGKPVLNLKVAENHSKFNKQANEREDTGTTYRRVALFGKKAEHLADRIGKGSLVHVSGREETRFWTGKDGQQGSSLEVTADDIGVIYEKNPTGQPPQYGGNQQQSQQRPPQQRPQQQQADPWSQQAGGNYDWGSGGNDTPPF